MTTGFSGAGKCYQTAEEATSAHWSSSPLATNSDSGGTNYFYITSISHNASGWYSSSQLCNLIYSGGTCGTVFSNPLPAFVPVSCTLDAGTAPADSGLPAGFDYTILGALFAFFFSVVTALYFIGKSGGAIVNIFRPR